MPGGKTKFNPDWVKSGHGCRLSEWCQPSKSSQYSAYCSLCNSEVRCDNQGLQQLIQHAQYKGHQKRAKSLSGGSQMLLTFARPSTSTASVPVASAAPNPAVLACMSQKESVTKAELIWTLKVARSNMGYSSCDGLKDLLQAMFPGVIPDSFSMSSSKVSDLISEATGPYFQDMMLKDLEKSGSGFSIMYDETTNKQNMKQLEISLRYWSDTKEQILVHRLKTYLMGHATGEDLSRNILSALDESKLQLKDVIMLGSDGPNVSTTVWRKIDKAILDTGGPGLLDVGTCTLHIVHNAFAKGLAEYCENIPELTVDIFYWFKGSAARSVDLHDIQHRLGVSAKKPLKHVECRWLTLGPAVERLLEIWESLREYFLVTLPKQQPKDISKPRYKRIRTELQRPEIKAQLHFLKFMAATFAEFLTFFQSEQPLVHILYDKLNDLLKKLIRRVMKTLPSGSDAEKHPAKVDVNIVANQLDNGSMGVGDDSRRYITKLKTSDRERMYMGIRKFYRAAIDHLQKKLPLSNRLLKHARCLQPQNRAAAWSVESAKSLSRLLNRDIDGDGIADEWKVYQEETIPADWSQETHENGEVHMKRVDQYWAKVLALQGCTGNCKFPQLKKMTRIVLALSHGNSDMERAFSFSGKSVTKDRVCLSEASINGLRATTDGMKICGDRPEDVPITKELLSLGRSAHMHYMQRLEEERKAREEKRKEMEKSRQEKEDRDRAAKVAAEKAAELCRTSDDFKKTEKSLAAKESSEQMSLTISNSLLDQANTKLKEALKKGDMTEIAVAQAMLESAQRKIKETQTKMIETRDKQRKVEKKKQTTIDSMVAAKKKK